MLYLLLPKTGERERETKMMVTCVGTAAVFGTWRRWRRPPMMTVVCLGSAINTDQLRAQLDQLHLEADHTRAKANSARLRLMRLSEAAEKLRRQAAINVQTGREDDARELLFQKKKVMQALEKSKTRITLLDELSSKLTEAISVKETQLIENVASDLNIGREDASSTVRIVSPKDEETRNLSEDEDLDLNAINNEDQVWQVHTEDQADQSFGDSADDLTGYLIRDARNEADTINSLKGISSYEDFIEHLDQQLDKIEAELIIVLRISTMVLEENEKPKNSRVRQTVELLEGIQDVRQRISSIMQK